MFADRADGVRRLASALTRRFAIDAHSFDFSHLSDEDVVALLRNGASAEAEPDGVSRAAP